jgi:hypothetical protein
MALRTLIFQSESWTRMAWIQVDVWLGPGPWLPKSATVVIIHPSKGPTQLDLTFLAT